MFLIRNFRALNVTSTQIEMTQLPKCQLQLCQISKKCYRSPTMKMIPIHMLIFNIPLDFFVIFAQFANFPRRRFLLFYVITRQDKWMRTTPWNLASRLGVKLVLHSCNWLNANNMCYFRIAIYEKRARSTEIFQDKLLFYKNDRWNAVGNFSMESSLPLYILLWIFSAALLQPNQDQHLEIHLAKDFSLCYTLQFFNK